MVVTCSWCNSSIKMNPDDMWLPTSKEIVENFRTETTSDGICDDCVKVYFPDFFRLDRLEEECDGRR